MYNCNAGLYTPINQCGELWGLLEFNKFNKTAFWVQGFYFSYTLKRKTSSDEPDLIFFKDFFCLFVCSFFQKKL